MSFATGASTNMALRRGGPLYINASFPASPSLPYVMSISLPQARVRFTVTYGTVSILSFYMAQHRTQQAIVLNEYFSMASENWAFLK